jgi:serine/threonine protein kinase
MTPARWQKACDLFAAALERPAIERGIFLTEACGGDDDLRRDLETLLASDSRANSAFEQLPAAVVSAASGASAVLSLPGRGLGEGSLARESLLAPESLIGTRIGHYEIKRVIGSGGMSTVYEAVQDSPRRTVALKMMKPGVVSRAALRRFEFEAETLARLRHPNIAQIYEAGTYFPEGSEFRVQGSGDQRSGTGDQGSAGGGRPTRQDDSPLTTHHSPDEGLPWFAMEYLPNARPITDYARAANLTTRQRLELFVKVCHAVAHGHEKGIIHRDLKPANILVADEGSLTAEAQRAQREDSFLSVLSASAVKVIDFGIARATDSDLSVTRETQAGALIGTLQYMSPEQCDPGYAPPQSEPRRVSERDQNRDTPSPFKGEGRGAGTDSPLTTHPSPLTPHQVGDIDTRSDVYSLGVVLYELLADRLPYDISTTTVYRAIKIVMEQTPEPLFSMGSEFRVQGSGQRRSPSPSQGEGRGEGATPSPCKGEGRGEGGPRRGKSKIRRGELRDVEAIVMKALAKDPARRYRSAGDLAADLERHLRGDPTEARPPTAWERGARWIARHPTRATLVTCISLALLTFVATYAAFWFYNARPYELQRSGREVRLLAMSGRTLHRWHTSDPNGFVFAELVETALGTPDKLVMLAFPREDDSEHYGRLCAFDASAPQRLVWRSTVEESELPRAARDRGHSAIQFAYTMGRVADVFPELPGDEVIAVFAHAAPRLVRVYDLSGAVRYQAWIYGGVEHLYRMAARGNDAGLLVLAVRDEAHGREEPDPLRVVALRPEPAHIGTDFLPLIRGDEWTAWCLRLRIPDDAALHVKAVGLGPGSAEALAFNVDPARALSYSVTFDCDGSPACGWIISDWGEVVSPPRCRDEYAQIWGSTNRPPWLPDPNALALEPCECAPPEVPSDTPEASTEPD